MLSHAIISLAFSNACHRPNRVQCRFRPPSQTCSYFITPTGSPRPGEPCFSLSWTNISSIYQQTYQSGQRRFTRFCCDAGLQPLPLTENLLTLFVSHLATEGLAHTTIKSYLSAVRFFHITAGHGDPFIPGAFPHLQYVIRGIKCAPRPPSHSHLPITPSLLRSLKSVWVSKPADADCIMLWAACCMGFMRAGEFTLKSSQNYDLSSCLTPQDVAVDQHANPSTISIHLKQSKTDPFRHGVDIYLGRTDSALCPVVAILAYVAIRPKIPGPFFMFRDGSPLTRDKLVTALRKALTEVGVDQSGFLGHSFRIGAATSPARAGSLIKMLGRWESEAYQRYVCTPRVSLAAISSQLAILL